MRPNKMGNYKSNPKDSYHLGMNQIKMQFKDALTNLLNFNYYEGTVYSNNCKCIFDKNGKSKIYVEQKELHEQLDEFLADSQTKLCYLVGYTGVGKTTLLRNYFQVYDRSPKYTDNKIILYKSFLSDVSNKDTTISNIVARCINNVNFDIIKDNKNSINKKLIMLELYEYIKNNKPEVLYNSPIVPKNLDDIIDDNYESQLTKYAQTDQLGYSLMMLKYLLVKFPKYNSIIIIFDDIERHSKEMQMEFLDEIIRKFYDCFSAIEVNCNIKIIVSLRNYLMRALNATQSQASRIYACTILKKSVPSLTENIQRRFNAFNEFDKNSYIEAQKELEMIFEKLYIKYDELILNLTQKNIYESLLIFTKILTNKKYAGYLETSKDGAFKIDSNRYPLKSDDVFYALAYGEGEHYDPINNYFLANILLNHEEVCNNGDIISMYIVIYYLSLCHELYGENAIPVNRILERLDRVFSDYSLLHDGYEKFSDKGYLMIEQLYKNGILLKSVNDIEIEADFCNDYSRTCNTDSLLYISPRGEELFKLLVKNSLYFNVIRDDIDTELAENDRASVDMSENQKIEYYIDYIISFFEKEKNYIIAAHHSLEEYIKCFGNELITSLLMQGFVQSMAKYFSEMSNTNKVMRKFFHLYEEVLNYISAMKSEYAIEFKVSDIVKSYYEKNQMQYAPLK